MQKGVVAGTRLYPNTEDRAVLAQLAAVPESTWERLEQLPQVEQCRGDKEVSVLEDFLLFGWSRADAATILAFGFDTACDGTDDPKAVRRLLVAHHVDLKGVEIDRLEGLHWF